MDSKAAKRRAYTAKSVHFPSKRRIFLAIGRSIRQAYLRALNLIRFVVSKTNFPTIFNFNIPGIPKSGTDFDFCPPFVKHYWAVGSKCVTCLPGIFRFASRNFRHIASNSSPVTRSRQSSVDFRSKFCVKYRFSQNKTVFPALSAFPLML